MISVSNGVVFTLFPSRIPPSTTWNFFMVYSGAANLIVSAQRPLFFVHPIISLEQQYRRRSHTIFGRSSSSSNFSRCLERLECLCHILLYLYEHKLQGITSSYESNTRHSRKGADYQKVASVWIYHQQLLLLLKIDKNLSAPLNNHRTATLTITRIG